MRKAVAERPGKESGLTESDPIVSSLFFHLSLARQTKKITERLV